MSVSPTVPLPVCLHAYLFVCLLVNLLDSFRVSLFSSTCLSSLDPQVVYFFLSFFLSFVSYLMKFTELCSLQEWCLRIHRYCFT